MRRRHHEAQDGQELAFAKLKAGFEDAIAYHRGAKQLTVREVELEPLPPKGAKEVLAARAQLRVSHAAFARILDVSPRTVQGVGGELEAAVVRCAEMLSVGKKNPEVLLRMTAAGGRALGWRHPRTPRKLCVSEGRR